MKNFLSIALILLNISAFGQDIEQNEWYSRHDSKLYYGLTDFPISSFLKVEDGILLYSHQKEELLYLNDNHLIQKKWRIKSKHKVMEDPTLHYYDNQTVVLGSFLDRKSYWLRLKTLRIWKEADKLNPEAKYKQTDDFHYASFAGYKIVMNQNNNHPAILASLFAYRGLSKQKLFSIDIPNSGIANKGNIIDVTAHNGLLWTLDGLNKEIIVFDSSLNILTKQSISFLWPPDYLNNIVKQGLAIRVDCKWLFDHIENKLYLFNQSNDRSEKGVEKLTQVFHVTVEGSKINFEMVLEKKAYLDINQIIGGAAYFITGGEELANTPSSTNYDFDGKTEFVYSLEVE